MIIVDYIQDLVFRQSVLVLVARSFHVHHTKFTLSSELNSLFKHENEHLRFDILCEISQFICANILNCIGCFYFIYYYYTFIKNIFISRNTPELALIRSRNFNSIPLSHKLFLLSHNLICLII